MKKFELLDWLREENRQWEAFLDQIGPERMDQPGVTGHWSIKDIVAHLTGWQIRLNDALPAALRAEPEPEPPWPVHLRSDDDINAWIEASNRDRSASEVMEDSRRVLRQYMTIIESLPDDVRIERLWRLITLGDRRFPAGEFFDHFHDDHEPDIRAWLSRPENNGAGLNIVGWRSHVWQQFGAAIDTLDHAIRECPDAMWRSRLWSDPGERPEYAEFWFIAYHTLYWLDLYLTGTADGFAPPDRFRRYEKDAGGKLPMTPYTKADIRAYLDECRERCRATIESLTERTALRPCTFKWIGVEISYLELLLYTMRHVQEHAAQLNLVLGQHHIPVDDSVPRAETRPS